MMKKNTVKKMITAIGISILMLGSVTGCGAADSPNASAEAAELIEVVSTDEAASTDEVTAEENSGISGSIAMAGSTSMEKFANALAESFMAKYPDVTVSAEFTGSSAGIEAVLAGSVDIGNSSRNLKEEEMENGVVENVVAIDGIAVVTDAENTVTNLTKEDLIRIYTGEIKNWSELGGEDAAIVVVGREAGSGTRGAFEELLGIEDACAYANELDSTGAVMAKVASTAGAIGYVSLDVLDNTVLAMSLDEVEPTAENIKAGTYFLSRPFVMATNGEVSGQSEAVQAMFDYLHSEEGKELIHSVGLIAID